MRHSYLLKRGGLSITKELVMLKNSLGMIPGEELSSGGARNFPTDEADSSDEGPKIRFSGYYEYQKSPK